MYMACKSPGGKYTFYKAQDYTVSKSTKESLYSTYFEPKKESKLTSCFPCLKRNMPRRYAPPKLTPTRKFNNLRFTLYALIKAFQDCEGLKVADIQTSTNFDINYVIELVDLMYDIAEHINKFVADGIAEELHRPVELYTSKRTE